jgi:hypothetical protein
MADMFRNHQRTSARNVILKAEATLLFARVLAAHGVEFLQDMAELSGSDDQVGSTRMIQRYTVAAIDRHVTPEQAREIVFSAVAVLKTRYPQLTGRLLDHEIWGYQRQLEADAA